MIDWDTQFAKRAGRMTASEIRELLKLLDQPDIISFAGGIPDPSLFPQAEIAQKARSQVRLCDARLSEPDRRQLGSCPTHCGSQPRPQARHAAG
jgi:DNA-binding transcriptional MocR family regulator